LLAHLLDVEGYRNLEIDVEHTGQDGSTRATDVAATPAIRILDLDHWVASRSAAEDRAGPSGSSESIPTIVVGHSSDRSSVHEEPGVVYLESNSSFNDLRTGLRSALERVLPC
jgi:hypothetical protein